jgi:hypothetical protein
MNWCIKVCVLSLMRRMRNLDKIDLPLLFFYFCVEDTLFFMWYCVFLHDSCLNELLMHVLVALQQLQSFSFIYYCAGFLLGRPTFLNGWDIAFPPTWSVRHSPAILSLLVFHHRHAQRTWLHADEGTHMVVFIIRKDTNYGGSLPKTKSRWLSM